MKIAVPLIDGQFSAHFGGAQAFALYTVNETSRTIDERRVVVPPDHGRGVFPMWLKQIGAEVVLAGGMGPSASDIFAHHGIDVVLGVQGDHPDTVVFRFLDGTLESTGELCRDHDFHDCGHHRAGPGPRDDQRDH